MAAGEYLKSAASSLYRAADSLKQQAKEMQANLTRLQSEKKSQIDNASLELKSTQAEQVGIDNPARRSYLSVRIQKLQNEIVAAQQEMKEAEANLHNAVAAKLSTSTAIESQAKQLESQASSVD